jgi:ParB family chromosome partitioning protein
MTTATDLYQRPRTPAEERRLRELTDQLVATGAVTPDDAPASAAKPLPGAAQAPAGPAGQAAGGQGEALISRVHPHPRNIRSKIGVLEEMAASMRAHGILQPIAVEPHPDRAGHWQVIAGHRRLEAAKLAGLDVVPITLRQPDAGTLPGELMLIENLHREGLNAIDKAEAMGELRDAGYSVARISQSIGLAEGTVYYYLSLLDLDDKSRQRVRDGLVTAADAVAGIRRERKKQRKREGRAPVGGGMWEPDHFTGQHPLARRAAALCDAREHTMRRRVGRTACGQCWETVIREDERTVKATLAAHQ